MFPRTEKLVFNFRVPIYFFLSLESIKLNILAVPARNACEQCTITFTSYSSNNYLCYCLPQQPILRRTA